MKAIKSSAFPFAVRYTILQTGTLKIPPCSVIVPGILLSKAPEGKKTKNGASEMRSLRRKTALGGEIRLC
jgi:hypothetical protein